MGWTVERELVSGSGEHLGLSSEWACPYLTLWSAIQKLRAEATKRISISGLLVIRVESTKSFM
jgi:hypothetical protein